MAKIEEKVKGCKNLARTKRLDLHNLQVVATGITELDRFMEGGLAVGYVHALAACEATGKTSVAAQLQLRAAEQDIPTFSYYGEDSEEVIKNKITHMACGSFGMDFSKNRYGEVIKVPSPLYEKRIDDWLDGYLHNWEPELMSNDKFRDFVESIIDFSEKCRTVNSVGLVIADNLMKLVDMCDGRIEMNSRQSFICNTLADLAKNLKNLCIVLVVHTRKAVETENENNNLSGSANIKNSVATILQYSRDEKDKDGNNRHIKVTKNRIFGKTNSKTPMVVSYDPETMRTYSIDDVAEQFHEYPWLTQLKGETFYGFEKEMLDKKQARVNLERKHAEECVRRNKEAREYERKRAEMIAQENAMIADANRRSKLENAKKRLAEQNDKK